MFRRLVVALSAAAALFVPALLNAQNCASAALSDRSAMWKTNVNIPVWFDDPTMLTACQSQFQTVLNNWMNSGANGEFGVSFTFTNDPNAFGAVRVYHSPPSDPSKAGYFQPYADPDPSAPGMLDAKLWLSTSLQGCGALAGAFAHEIGHGFGLADCYGSTCSGSVMQQQQAWNWAGPQGPTTCDVNGVQHYLDPILMYEKGETTCSAPKICPMGQVLEPSSCLCHIPDKPIDPLLIDVDGDGIDLTSVAEGVDFDYEGWGVRRHTAWTRAGGDDGWLAIDRNGNGRIDDGSELFGNLSPQPASGEPNGFLALAVYDQPRAGGNGDGAVTAADAVFASLLVWQDRNHDGVAQADEVRPLAATGVTSIELQARVAGRRDPNGNLIRYRARVESDRNPGRGHWAYDVFVQTTH